MKQRYIYIDETVFDLPIKEKKHKCFGVGALLTKKKISQNIINEALNELKQNLRTEKDNMEDIVKKMDINTLSKLYFHAANDSKNAHSCLCNTIRKYVSGNIKVSYFVPSLQEPGKKKRTDEQLHRLNSALSILSNTHSSIPVMVILEKRNKFGAHQAEKFADYYYQQLELTIYRQPGIPAFFPHIDIQILDKSEPGIQVIDFILWVLQESKVLGKPCTWEKRLKLERAWSTNQIGGPISSNYCYLKKEITDPARSYPKGTLPLNDDEINNNDLANFYCKAEQILHDLSKQGLPEYARHLEIKLKNLCPEIRKLSSFGPEHVRKVASIFLQLFDTLPIYNEIDNVKETKMLLYAKKYLALTLHTEEANGVSTCDSFARIRRHYFKNKPEVLGITRK